MATPPPDPPEAWPTRLQHEPYDWEREPYDDGDPMLGLILGLLFTWAIAATVACLVLVFLR